MTRRVVCGAVAGALLVLGLWYGVSRPATAPPTNTVPAKPGSVRPNAELADIFTQLEREWAQVGTTVVETEPKPVAANGTTKKRKEKR